MGLLLVGIQRVLRGRTERWKGRRRDPGGGPARACQGSELRHSMLRVRDDPEYQVLMPMVQTAFLEEDLVRWGNRPAQGHGAEKAKTLAFGMEGKVAPATSPHSVTESTRRFGRLSEGANPSGGARKRERRRARRPWATVATRGIRVRLPTTPPKTDRGGYGPMV